MFLSGEHLKKGFENLAIVWNLGYIECGGFLNTNGGKILLDIFILKSLQVVEVV